MMLRIGVQNGGHDNIPVHWSFSESLTIEKLLDRMEYLLNAGSYRAEHKLPNAIKIVVDKFSD